MDLKVKDVADLLHVSESTIYRWLDGSKIPAYKLGEEWRFSREDIQDWLIETKRENSDEPQIAIEPRGGIKQYSLYRAVHKGGIRHHCPGTQKEEVIDTVCRWLAEDLGFDASAMAELIKERETLMSTALGGGIAVPHTREITIDSTYDAVSIVFPKEPIDWNSLDGEPVNVVFFLFACDDRRHLNLLAKIAHLAQNKELMNFIRTSPSKNDVLNAIRSWESAIRPS